MNHQRWADRQLIRNVVTEGRHGRKLRILSRPSLHRSIMALCVNWFLILSSVGICLTYHWMIPVAVIVIGSRQRALSNLTHDASHGNLFRTKKVNDSLSDTFTALPMFETVAYYRKNHLKHHAHLGDVNLDPDSKSHLRYGFRDDAPWTASLRNSYRRLLFNRAAFTDSIMGSLFDVSLSELSKVVVWWLIFGVLIASVLNFQFLLLFSSLWFSARATSYHAIRIFAEFLDHTGLTVGGILSFSRTVPGGAPLVRYIVHPHNDNFHLVHHLYPKIPHYNLGLAHQELIDMPLYKVAHHCDGYFFGDHTAVDCWLGRCQKRVAL